MWNGTAFEIYAAGSVTNYGIDFIDQGGGHYSAGFPEEISVGWYYLDLYYRSGASQADTDNVIGSRWAYWDGEDISPEATEAYVDLAIEAAKSTLYVSSNITEAT